MEDRLIRDEDTEEEVVTEIICIVDRSGSMHSIVDDAVGGFNSFVDEQRKLPDKAYLTLVIFDKIVDIVCESTPIKEMKEITRETIQPRDTTALWDAIGKTLLSTGLRIVDSKVIVVIITDGHENASVEYTGKQVKEMIGVCKKDGWEFMFLGADLATFTMSSDLGFSADQTVQYAANSRGIQSAYSSINDTVSQFRGAGNNFNESR
jgi:Mg-chelatase subunit ChlD